MVNEPFLNQPRKRGGGENGVHDGIVDLVDTFANGPCNGIQGAHGVRGILIPRKDGALERERQIYTYTWLLRRSCECRNKFVPNRGKKDVGVINTLKEKLASSPDRNIGKKEKEAGGKGVGG